MHSFKSNGSIQKKKSKKDGPDRSVSYNQASSVALNKLAMKASKTYYNFKFKQTCHAMTGINLNGARITKDDERDRF